MTDRHFKFHFAINQVYPKMQLINSKNTYVNLGELKNYSYEQKLGQVYPVSKPCLFPCFIVLVLVKLVIVIAEYIRE